MFNIPKILQRTSAFYKNFPKPLLIQNILKIVQGYHEEYLAALRRQIGQEFKVQIRDGCITDEGLEILCSLKDDFETLQVDENLVKIITEVSSLIKQQDILAILMGDVRSSLLKAFESTIQSEQEVVRKTRSSKEGKKGCR